MRRDYYLKAGRVCNKISFHLDGLMRIFAWHGEKEVTQWISYKGNFITDLRGIIFDEPGQFSFQALTRCELYTIDKADFLLLHERIGRWPVLERAFISRCFNFMEARVFSLLSMSGEERYGYLMGMTPESLSRIRKKK